MQFYRKYSLLYTDSVFVSCCPLIIISLSFFLILCFTVPAIAYVQDEDRIVNSFIQYVVGRDQRRAERTIDGMVAPSRIDPTTLVLDVARNWDELSTESKEKLSKNIKIGSWRDGKRTVAASDIGFCTDYVNPKSDAVMDSQNFRVIYKTSGSHAATNAYVQSVLVAAEKSWSTVVASMGFPVPRYTSESKIWIYLCNLTTETDGILGIAWPEELYNDDTAKGHIELDNNYTEIPPSYGITPSEFVKITMSHEFFHIVQFGVNYMAPSTWIMEATATWAEEEVYPEINDYLVYLDERFDYIGTSIDEILEGQTLQYGSGLFFRYITERVTGRDFMRVLWNGIKSECAAPSPPSWCDDSVVEFPLIDEKLALYSKTFRAVYRDFNIANLLKDYVDGGSSDFPDIFTSFIYSQSSGSLDHAAAKFYSFSYTCSTAFPQDFTVNFTGATGMEWEVSVIQSADDEETSIYNISTADNGSFTSNSFCEQYTKARIIVNNGSMDKNDKSFTLSVNVTHKIYTGHSSSFLEGWNLISFPYIPVYKSLRTNFGAADFQSVLFNSGAYSISDDITGYTPGTAFWVWFESPATVLIYGSVSSEDEVELEAGWNLVSVPFNQSAEWNSLIKVIDGSFIYQLGDTYSAVCLEPYLYRYRNDIEEPTFEGPIGVADGFTMNQTQGYAVKALKSCRLRFP